MPRTPTIRYFESRSAYYTQYHGKQHMLAAGPKDDPDGPTYQAAVQRFARIMHVDEMARAEDNTLVSALIARYYHSLDRDNRKGTLHQARTLLDPAIAEFGHIKVKDVKPFVVRDWIDKMHQWNSTSRHTAISALVRVFYWAKEEGMITANPIAEMTKPERLVRGKEVIIPDALQDVLIDAAHPEFAKALRFMRGTGCRPGEMMNASCHHYDKEIGALVFSWNAGDYRWKNAKKTQKDRVIYLTPDLQQMVEEEIEKRDGEGRIFMTVRGVPWVANNLVNRFDKLLEHDEVQKWCKEHKFNSNRIMCYSFRHSYITNMLKKGCPIKLLADLCGTSVVMIEKNYSKAHDDHHAMRRLFLQFSGASADQPSLVPHS